MSERLHLLDGDGLPGEPVRIRVSFYLDADAVDPPVRGRN